MTKINKEIDMKSMEQVTGGIEEVDIITKIFPIRPYDDAPIIVRDAPIIIREPNIIIDERRMIPEINTNPDDLTCIARPEIALIHLP